MISYCAQAGFPVLVLHRDREAKCTLTNRLESIQSDLKELEKRTKQDNPSRIDIANWTILKSKEKEALSQSSSSTKNSEEILYKCQEYKLPFIKTDLELDCISPLIEGFCDAKSPCFISYIASEDNTFLMGANSSTKPLIRLLHRSVRFHLNPINVYRLPDILQALNFTLQQWYEVGLLLGVNKTKKLAGIGIQSIHKGIRDFGTVELYVEKKLQSHFSSEEKQKFLDSIVDAREKLKPFTKEFKECQEKFGTTFHIPPLDVASIYKQARNAQSLSRKPAIGHSQLLKIERINYK